MNEDLDLFRRYNENEDPDGFESLKSKLEQKLSTNYYCMVTQNGMEYYLDSDYKIRIYFEQLIETKETGLELERKYRRLISDSEQALDNLKSKITNQIIEWKLNKRNALMITELSKLVEKK